MRRTLVACTLTFVAAACSTHASASNTTNGRVVAAELAARDSAAHQAHANYVRVINDNNLDSLSSMLTDDVVFLAANDKPTVGKAAVRAWGDAYLKAFHTHWDKPVQEFIVSGDYAFERYSYTSTDTPVGGGKPVVDTGWGLVVYHRDTDGVWRVARDAFGPDHPPAAK